MRKFVRAGALLAAALAPLQPLSAQGEAEVDMDLMQTIEDTHKSLASNIALKDGAKSAADAQELSRLFVVVQRYFERKGDAADAVAISKKSRELAEGIVTQVGGRDFDGATGASTAIGRACRECHTFYKKS